MCSGLCKRSPCGSGELQRAGQGSGHWRLERRKGSALRPDERKTHLLCSRACCRAAQSHCGTGTRSCQTCSGTRAGTRHCPWSTRPCLGEKRQWLSSLPLRQQHSPPPPPNAMKVVNSRQAGNRSGPSQCQRAHRKTQAHSSPMTCHIRQAPPYLLREKEERCWASLCSQQNDVVFKNCTSLKAVKSQVQMFPLPQMKMHQPSCTCTFSRRPGGAFPLYSTEEINRRFHPTACLFHGSCWARLVTQAYCSHC